MRTRSRKRYLKILSVMIACTLLVGIIPNSVVQHVSAEPIKPKQSTLQTELANRSLNKVEAPMFKREKKDLMLKRQERSEITQNENGKYTKKMYFAPVNRVNKDKKNMGEFERVSNRLVK